MVSGSTLGGSDRIVIASPRRAQRGSGHLGADAAALVRPAVVVPARVGPSEFGDGVREPSDGDRAQRSSATPLQMPTGPRSASTRALGRPSVPDRRGTGVGSVGYAWLNARSRQRIAGHRRPHAR